MKLHNETPEAGTNTVNAYGGGFIEVNRVRHRAALLVPARGAPSPWSPGSWADLDEAALAPAIALAPQVLLLGSGAARQPLPPAALRVLAQAGIGFEVMDTGAACRTFNLLVSEGRQVVAAMFPPPASPVNPPEPSQ